MIRRLLLVIILFMTGIEGLPLLNHSTVLHAAAASAPATYAGWAMDAYPGDTVSLLRAEMQKQLSAGANVIWIGHDNPGDVGGTTKVEPGLSFAVWYAALHSALPDHQNALAMIAAQTNALVAARSLGVKVIFPIGYQSQMGADWTKLHLDDVRRDAAGHPLNGPNPTNIVTSFYSPAYRHDIVAYYRWVDTTFVQPYKDTIMMLNLADEPRNGDYSTWADQAFMEQYGFHLTAAGLDAQRQQEVGRFESEYINNYAIWSAQQWLAIDPAIKVTMSYCGGYGRYIHQGPTLETVFRDAPPNYVVTYDAYPRDGLYNTPLRHEDIVALFTLIRTLGYLSGRYHRPLWLWSTANSWGLNEASNDPGTIADAMANNLYLVALARQTGGEIQGVAVWNYNIRGQGLFNDTHHLTYDPATMFARISAQFALMRQMMSAPGGSPRTVILAPDEPVWQAMGAGQRLWAIDPYGWGAMDALAQSNSNAISLSHNDDLPTTLLKTLILLAPSAASLSPADRALVHTVLANGGTVIAASTVAATFSVGLTHLLWSAPSPSTHTVVMAQRVAAQTGTLVSITGAPVEEAFSIDVAGAACAWWASVFGQVLTEGYVVENAGLTLLYRIDPTIQVLTWQLPVSPQAHTLVRYDQNGSVSGQHSYAPGDNSVAVSLDKRTFALIRSAALQAIDNL